MILLCHAAVTWAMTGLIWFVQLVHYPLFARVDPAGFAAFESQHARWTLGAVLVLFLMSQAGGMAGRP